MIVAAILLVAAMMFFVERTKTGQAVRAVAENRDAAILMGVNVKTIPLIVFGMSTALGVAAGIMVGALFAIAPGIGEGLVVKGFAVLILGGLGSFPGAILGGTVSRHHRVDRGRLHFIRLQGCDRFRGHDPCPARATAGIAGARAMKRTLAILAWVIGFACLAALPQVLTVKYYLHLSVLALIWVIMAQGQNLIQGYSGYVSIVGAGFMGIGAYSSTLFGMHFQWPVWATMAAAPLVTALFALATGYPSLRVKGHYFAIVTLAFNLIIVIVLVNFKELTNGEAGISTFRSPGAAREAYFYLVLALAAALTLLAAMIAQSRVGEILLAIRQNEDLVGRSASQPGNISFSPSSSQPCTPGWQVRSMPTSRGSSIRRSLVSRSRSTPFWRSFSVAPGQSQDRSSAPSSSSSCLNCLRFADSFRLILYGLILVLATIFMPIGLSGSARP